MNNVTFWIAWTVCWLDPTPVPHEHYSLHVYADGIEFSRVEVPRSSLQAKTADGESWCHDLHLAPSTKKITASVSAWNPLGRTYAKNGPLKMTCRPPCIVRAPQAPPGELLLYGRGEWFQPAD